MSLFDDLDALSRSQAARAQARADTGARGLARAGRIWARSGRGAGAAGTGHGEGADVHGDDAAAWANTDVLVDDATTWTRDDARHGEGVPVGSEGEAGAPVDSGDDAGDGDDTGDRDADADAEQPGDEARGDGALTDDGAPGVEAPDAEPPEGVHADAPGGADTEDAGQDVTELRVRSAADVHGDPDPWGDEATDPRAPGRPAPAPAAGTHPVTAPTVDPEPAPADAVQPEVVRAPSRRGRHRAPSTPWWVLRPTPRHARPAPAPAAAPASAPVSPPPVPPATAAPDRRQAPAPTLSPTALARYERIGLSAERAPTGTDAEPVVLAYAGVDASGRGGAVPPRRLADHLAVLHATGHRTVGVQQLLDHASGARPLPPRSVVITFAPDAPGLHEHADPALAVHDAGASALVAGDGPWHGSADALEPGLARLLATGRWEVVPAAAVTFAAPRRVTVTPGTTAAALVAALREMTAVPVADIAPNLVSTTWLDLDGAPAPVVVDGADLAVGASAGAEVVADWAPRRTTAWGAYAVDVSVEGLVAVGDAGSAGTAPGAVRGVGLGASGAAGLRVRTGRVGEVAAVLSADALTLRRGAGGTSTHHLPRAGGEHVLHLDVDERAVVVAVDGREVARLLALPGDHQPRMRDGAPGEPATAGSLGVVARRGADGFPRLVGLVVSAPGVEAPRG